MSRAGLCALVLLVVPLAALAQVRPRAHMEACTQWKSPGSHIGTRNDCDRPVSILFMDYHDLHVIEADVAPGDWFYSDAVRGPEGGYMFAVCPLGYIPSVRFALENRITIEDSLYNCLPRDRPGA